MANKAGIINADTGDIVGVPDALVNVAGVWKIQATAGGGGVPATRQINTTSPLAGGGDLSADRTLSIHVADATHDGYMTTTQVAALATAQTTADGAATAAAAAQSTANAAAVKANNLSDLTNASTARTNLGLGTVAVLAADTDITLAADSNSNVATQHAVKAYVDNLVTGVMKFVGSTDCSTNPNYPAAKKGEAYVVSVAGKIGGASGLSVEVGDVYVAIATNAGGTQAAVGASWDILQYNLVGALLSSNNLSDLANAATARTNLGLGSAATTASTDYATAAQGTLASGAAQKSANLSDLASAATARTNLGLGTAATANSTDFATAAQGTLASTAVQRAGDTMTGALSVGSTGTATNLQLSQAATAPGLGDASIFRINAAITALANGDLYAFKYDPTFIKAASGTHAYFLSVNLQPPTITTPGGSTAAITNAVTLFVGGAPTGATNNYAVWINSGKTRVGGAAQFDDKVGIGVATPTSQLHLGGSTTAVAGAEPAISLVATNITALAGGDIYGFKYAPTFTKAASGTHALFLGFNVQPPTIATPGGSTAAVTTAASFFIGNEPTGATNNYALYVYAGKSRFDGKVAVGGVTTPTALLHLAAGTATASTAPLKFTSGTNLTTPEAGAMEYDGTSLYFTNGASTRYNLTSPSPWSYDVAYNSAGSGASQYFNITNLAVNDLVEIEVNVRVSETSNNLTAEMAQVKARSTLRRPGTSTFATQILSATTDKQTTTNVAGFAVFIEEDATTKGKINIRVAGVAGYTLVGRIFAWVK